MKKILLFLPLFFATFHYCFAGGRQSAGPSASLREKIAILEKDSTPEALYHLSTLYENGFDSIPRDSIRSLNLLRQAAERGYAPAQNYLGFRLYESQPDSARYWINRAAEGGDLKALSNLAFLILSEDTGGDSIATAKKYQEAVPLLSRASDGGNAPAMTALADLYREGKGVEADTIRAESLYLDAVRLRNREAEQKFLAMNLERYARLSPEEALAEGLKAADAGAETVAFNLYTIASAGEIPRAYTLLADSYSSAKGTDYNHELALDNYIKGALGGDPSAQFILAELLEIFPDALQGKLPPDSPEEQATPSYWYSLAESSGVTTAQEAARRLFKIL